MSRPPEPDVLAAVRAHRREHGWRILHEYARLLAIDNDTRDLPALRRNAQAIAESFRDRGAQMDLVERPGAAPLVVGRYTARPDAPTLGVYVHYDGQPADPARRNVPGAEVRVGDARALELGDATVGACVSNLPFGQRYGVHGDMDAWLRSVLGEVVRVTRPGGKVVLLAPAVPRSVVPDRLRLRDRFPIRLLGTKTTIWGYDRTDGP